MNDVERAIFAFTEERSDERFEEMYQAVLSAEFIVPTGEEEVESKGNVHRIPVLCFRSDEGFAAVPAFTRLERLFDWRPQGSRYVNLAGDKLVDMVFAMPEIEVVAVNPKGAPRGLIPREHFLQMLAMHHGTEVEEIDRESYPIPRERPTRATITAMIFVVALTIVACFAIVYLAR